MTSCHGTLDGCLSEAGLPPQEFPQSDLPGEPVQEDRVSALPYAVSTLPSSESGIFHVHDLESEGELDPTVSNKLYCINISWGDDDQ
jgi:hypothetical protein